MLFYNCQYVVANVFLFTAQYTIGVTVMLRQFEGNLISFVYFLPKFSNLIISFRAVYDTSFLFLKCVSVETHLIVLSFSYSPPGIRSLCLPAMADLRSNNSQREITQL